MRNNPPCSHEVACERRRLRLLLEDGLASGPATPDTAEDHEELVRLAREANDAVVAGLRPGRVIQTRRDAAGSAEAWRHDREMRMSTRVTIRSSSPTEGTPGFHLYEDAVEALVSADGAEPPVYLQLEGVQAELQTLESGGVLLTVSLPRSVARELGLIPFTAASGEAAAP
jgi:hypothetical protein